MTTTSTITEACKFEWNVFEVSTPPTPHVDRTKYKQQQFLDWHQTATGPLSPESMPSPTHLSYEDHSTIMVDHSSRSQRSSSVSSDAPTAEISTTQKAPTVSTISNALSQSANPDNDQRRRIQNRKAQRAFRARQKQHVESLEDKLTAMMSEYEALQERYNQLRVAYEVVASKKEPQESAKMVSKNLFENQQFDFEAWGFDSQVTGRDDRSIGEKDADFEIDVGGYLMEDQSLGWSG